MVIPLKYSKSTLTFEVILCSSSLFLLPPHLQHHLHLKFHSRSVFPNNNGKWSLTLNPLVKVGSLQKSRKYRSREPNHEMNRMTFRQNGVFTFYGLVSTVHSPSYLASCLQSSRPATDPSPPPGHGSVSVWWSCCQVAPLPASGSLANKSTSPSAIVKQQGYYELLWTKPEWQLVINSSNKLSSIQYKCQVCKWTFKSLWIIASLSTDVTSNEWILSSLQLLRMFLQQSHSKPKMILLPTFTLLKTYSRTSWTLSRNSDQVLPTRLRST